MSDNQPVFIFGVPRLEVGAHYSPVARGVELHLWRRIPGFDHYDAVTGFVVESTDMSTAAAPSCVLDEKQAQRLLDELLLAGVRPTTNQDANATIQALREHIDSLKGEITWLRLRVAVAGSGAHGTYGDPG